MISIESYKDEGNFTIITQRVQIMCGFQPFGDVGM